MATKKKLTEGETLVPAVAKTKKVAEGKNHVIINSIGAKPKKVFFTELTYNQLRDKLSMGNYIFYTADGRPVEMGSSVVNKSNLMAIPNIKAR